MVGGLHPGDAGMLPLLVRGCARGGSCLLCWLWASRGPRSVATILRHISRLDLIKPLTTNMGEATVLCVGEDTVRYVGVTLRRAGIKSY